MGASVSSVYAGELGHSTSDGSEIQPGAIAGPASRVEALDASGSCDH